MKRLTAILLTLFISLTAVRCGRPGGDSASGKDNTPKTADNKTPGGKGDNAKDTEAIPVQVIKPYKGDISSFLLFSSNIDTEQIVDVYPMTTGIIQNIVRDEGDFVNKGDILASLDDREQVLNEKRAQINYEQLKMELERQQTIFEKQMLSKEEFERTRFRTETARLDWETSKLLLSYTRITSPISGVVSRRHIKAGNKISPAQLSFSVVQIQQKIVAVNIPGQELKNLFIKQLAEIIEGDRTVIGAVKRISPAIDPQSGTFKVTVEVNDPKNTLAIGQFVNVKIVKDIHKNVTLISKDALVYEGGKIFAFVITKDNKAIKKMVAIGFEDKQTVEVTEGLTEEDQVVTAGKSSLKNDTLVKIVEPVVS